MEVNVRTNIIRTITLNEEESEYIENLTQNYLGDGDEPERDSIIRYNLFKAVTEPTTIQG